MLQMKVGASSLKTGSQHLSPEVRRSSRYPCNQAHKSLRTAELDSGPGQRGQSWGLPNAYRRSTIHVHDRRFSGRFVLATARARSNRVCVFRMSALSAVLCVELMHMSTKGQYAWVGVGKLHESSCTVDTDLYKLRVTQCSHQIQVFPQCCQGQDQDVTADQWKDHQRILPGNYASHQLHQVGVD